MPMVAMLTQKQVRRGVFTSVPHLEKCLREYLHRYNENPRPLVWTKTVDEILEKVHRGPRDSDRINLTTILLRTLH